MLKMVNRTNLAPPNVLHSALPVPRIRAARIWRAQASAGARTSMITAEDLRHLNAAAELSGSSAGLTQPHPNAACIIARPPPAQPHASNGSSASDATSGGADDDGSTAVAAAAFQRAHGSTPAEVLATRAAVQAAAGATAYLNLEPGDTHGEDAAVAALIRSQITRAVIGLRHPLPHHRGAAVAALRAAGVVVDLLGEAQLAPGVGEADASAALETCLRANEGLLHRAALRRPLSILKYAMTLDGKIATAAGHAAWVSSPASRDQVFEMRARSDAIVVGGNTVRRDNPNLTTRREGGFTPWRIVMTRTLDLPEDAHLWNVSVAPTIVMTQRGVRLDFQKRLRSRGVEVVEFDFLSPESVADYCFERGFMQVFWECGGTLSAPAISSGVIHKVMAFVCPKIIGGARAPSPVGELGFVEMTQAVNLIDAQTSPSGPDVLITGYLPSSGGLLALERALSFPTFKPGSLQPGAWGAAAAAVCGSPSRAGGTNGSTTAVGANGGGRVLPRNVTRAPRVIGFYKAWDEWGALGNFSPHPISVEEDEAGGGGGEWPSVEHYYQAAKYRGVASEEAQDLVDQIRSAPSPEEAARIGRRAERERPDLVRPGWGDAKRDTMARALRAKYMQHAGPRAMLLSTAGDAAAGIPAAQLVEASPNDTFWGQGFRGGGTNMLGTLLMALREEMLAQEEAAGVLQATGNGVQ